MARFPELPLAPEEFDTLDMTDTMDRFLQMGEAHAIAGDVAASENCFSNARRHANGDSVRYVSALLSRAAIYAERDEILYALHDLDECQRLLNETGNLEHLELKEAVFKGLLAIHQIVEQRSLDWPERRYRDITDEDTLTLPPAGWV